MTSATCPDGCECTDMGRTGGEKSLDKFASRMQLHKQVRVILVASSTGGPDVLCRYLGPLIDSGLDLPILLVQHIPAQYSKILATHLQRKLDYCCTEARDGETVQDGRIYVAPGDQHMRLNAAPRAYISLDRSPKVEHCRPSANVLFSSAASVFGSRVLAVVMTGMGLDGCHGAGQIVAAGGKVLAQDRASSAVWGMPGAVVSAGLARHVGSPGQLANWSIRIVRGK